MRAAHTTSRALHLLRRTLPMGLGLALIAGLSSSGAAGERAPEQVARAAPSEAPEAVWEPSLVELGQTLPSAPNLSPVGTVPPNLEDIRRYLAAGDEHRAMLAALDFVEAQPWGRDRDAAWFVIGTLHREAGRHNLASEAFTKVRAAKGPLAPWAAWFEAEQDLERGREWVAIKECETYRETWPRGPYADACLRLIAQAYAKLGRAASARSAAAQYDKGHKGAEIGEQIELTLAAWLAHNEPDAAVRPLQKLAIDHQAPLTGRVAEELLAGLASQGVQGAVLPSDTESLKRRALSLRDARRRDAAWSTFEELIRRAEEDPGLARWVDDAAESFGWRTHRWDFLADAYKAAYARSGKAEDAWSVYRALDRGGRHQEAGVWAVQEQQKHAKSREWRHKEEVIARTLLLAKDYAGARDQLDQVAGRGGWTGRRAAFVAGFATLMDGEHEDAVKRFTALLDDRRASHHHDAARYWRARAYDALEELELAEADRASLLEADPSSWYGVLVRQADPSLPQAKPFARDGTWGGAPMPPPPTLVDARAEVKLAPAAVSAPVLSAIRGGAVAFGRLAWPLGGFTSGLDPTPPVSVVQRHDELEPPASYLPGTFYDPDRTRADLYRYAEAHKDTWPELPAIYDLARVGLYDFSGPLMSAMFEDWREAYRKGGAKHVAARKAHLRGEQWRTFFYFTRDHHHAARFSFGLWENVEDEAVAREARRLAYPLAHDRYVWTHAREHDVDPFLVMGLMRQESTYNAIAVSRVGATGAMQIMPRTGHLLADLAHDTHFTAGDLEDPVLSVGYGIRYLGLLLERFEGVYPLAIASYNGGPFNVSNWLAGTGNDMPIDAFVEHIPFQETRDYVKKVTAGYARYLELYAPEPTQVVLPPTPRGDHREIVDF